MTDIRTISPDELPVLSEIPEDLHAVVFSPAGPLHAVPYEKLLTKLIAANLAKATKAALDADLAHPENSVALVFGDPTLALNGWYRKLGASGAGSWEQFEELARNAREIAQTWAVGVAPAGPGTKSAKEHAEDAAVDAEAAAAAAAAALASASNEYGIYVTGSPVPLGGYPAARSTRGEAALTRFYAESDASCVIAVRVNSVVVHSATVNGTLTAAVSITVPAGAAVDFWLISGTPTSIWAQVDGGAA